MQVGRKLALPALLLALTLFAAGCGNDPEATEETSAAGEEATEEESAAAGESSEAASEEGSEVVSASIDLGEVCETEFADVQAPDDFSVTLVTDIGSIDDGTFNQFGYEGMQAAADCFGFETDFIETANEADYANNINTALGGSPDVIVTSGALIGDATLEAATANPETMFIGIDQFQEEYPENYVGVLFREDQGGFLAGAMAGLLTESNVVGVVGGREDVPPVVRFVNGFAAGAAYIDESIQVLSVYNESFADPAGGASDAQQMLGEGADVIFGAGGPTGSGGVRAAAEAGAWGIGVDQDEYFTTFSGGSAPGADRLATSAIKRVDLGVFENIAAAVQDEFEGGVFELAAADGGVTYADFHDADIPEDVATQIEEIRAGLADGSIETGIDPITGQPL
jgi:basic membrane protein A